MTRAFISLLVVVLFGSCISGPFEHSNYFDPEGSATLTITGAPDSMHSVNSQFTLLAVSSGGFPAPSGAAGPTYQSVSGGSLVTQIADGVFRVTPSASLLPALVTIRAFVQPNASYPVDTVRVWIHQRPVTLAFTCMPMPDCMSLVAGGFSRLYTFSGTDANGFSLNVPSGTFRWGTAVSRSPTIAAIQSRPSGSTIEVTGLVPGTAWIVLFGEGAADSIQVTVVP